MLAASKQVGTPMFFGVVIITVVYVPILALTGIEGKMFHPMALTVMLALGGALVLALTLMPVLCSFLLRGKIHEGDNLVIRFVKSALSRRRSTSRLRLRWLVVVAARRAVRRLALAVHAAGRGVRAQLDEGSITSMLYKPVGMSMEESLAHGHRSREPAARRSSRKSRASSPASARAKSPPTRCRRTRATFTSSTSRSTEWPKTAGRPTNKAELREQIEALLKKINPDYNILFAQPIEMRFNEMLEGTKAELSVKIFGNDYDVLEKLAEQIKGILEKTPGAAQVEFETEGRTPQLQINVKRDVLQRYSLQARSEQGRQRRAGRAGGRHDRRRQQAPRHRGADAGGTARRRRADQEAAACASARPDLSRWASWSSSRR